jgi:hypothetical protein
VLLLLALTACRETLVPGVSAPERDAQRAWGRALKRAVTDDGYVDYDVLEQNREPLDAYVAWLATEDAWKGRLTKDWHHQFLNAYNALVIFQILVRGRPDSVMDVPSVVPKAGWGFFVGTDFQLDAEKLSLFEIEHERIRAKELDYRDHAAMNCGSRSCPPLRNELYKKEQLDEQLDEQMEAWVADDERGVRVEADGSIVMNPIFDWFHEDFEYSSAGRNICQVAMDHAVGPKRAALKQAAETGCRVRFFEYDWALNDAR